VTKTLKAIAATTAALLALNADAAVDMFLDIEGEIKGESLDSTYKDQIDVLAWSWAMAQSGTLHVGAGGGAGRASFGDIAVTKYIDRSSTVLYKYVANGDHFESATLTIRKPGGKPFVNEQLVMTRVLVTSALMGGSGGEDRLTENITLNFGSFCIRYIEQTKEGNPGAKLELCWNIAANESCSTAQIETLFRLPLVRSLPRGLLRELNPVCSSA